MLAAERWCFTTCALLAMCPRSSYMVSNYGGTSNKVLIPKPFDVHAKQFAPRWSLNILRDKNSVTTLAESRAGFSFNEDEMKKLKIWPGGTIPYYIDQLSFDKVLRDRIRTFLDMTNSLTGLNFLELLLPPDDDITRWVFFINRQGLLRCVDHAFKNFTIEGVQKILLGYDCLRAGGELAELILALVGVPPQHIAPDRHKYIEIVQENIMPGKAHLFEQLKDNEWLFHEVDYDFASAGHYSLHKYTVNGKATIKPLHKQDIAIGEGKGFSNTDIWKIRMIYNYISKKLRSSVRIPECNKLFHLGTNFDNHVQESEDDIQPIKKPNKYLGLPAEEADASASNQEVETNSSNGNSNIQEKESSEVESPEKEQDIEDEDEKIVNSKEKSNSKYSHKNKKEPIKDVGKEDVTDENPLTFIEDYGTDNLNKQPETLKFTKPGKGGQN